MQNSLSSLSSQDISLTGKPYIGYVVNNNDPDKLQRCQIRVASLHTNISDEDLPWAINGQLTGQGSTKGVGDVCIPAVGAKVTITFMDNSLFYPIYTATTTQVDVKIEELTATDYPHVVAKIDRSGSLHWINTKTDEWIFAHVSGTTLHFDGNGRIKILINDEKVGPDAKQVNPKGLTIEIQGQCAIHCTEQIDLHAQQDINLVAQGAITLSSQTAINLDAPVINDNGGGTRSPKTPEKPNTRERPEEPGFSNKTNF